jgi:hypothetical protein
LEQEILVYGPHDPLLALLLLAIVPLLTVEDREAHEGLLLLVERVQNEPKHHRSFALSTNLANPPPQILSFLFFSHLISFYFPKINRQENSFGAKTAEAWRYAFVSLATRKIFFLYTGGPFSSHPLHL